MATYNGAKYIKEQVDSILPQLGENDELVVSDDCSTDNTIDILKSYDDSRIKIYIFHRDKSGIEPIRLVTTNFENSLIHCKGDYIFLSDQDDVWVPNKVKIMMHYLEDLGYDYVESDCFVTDQNLNILRPNKREGIHINKWKMLFSTAYLQGSLCGFKRIILNDALPFPKDLQSHDRWLGYIALFKYRCLIPINQSLIYYRRHNESTIVNSKVSINQKIFERLKYCWFLAKRLMLKYN